MLRYLIILILFFTMFTICCFDVAMYYSIKTSDQLHQQQIMNIQELKQKTDNQALVETISKKYSIEPKLASKVVKMANKYARKDFPKAKDILAITAIESRFDPQAKSKLKKDPAIGLMQVRVKVWKDLIADDSHTVENQIKHGSAILSMYYGKLGNVNASVMAYNVGISAYRSGKKNEKYLDNYKVALNSFTENSF